MHKCELRLIPAADELQPVKSTQLEVTQWFSWSCLFYSVRNCALCVCFLYWLSIFFPSLSLTLSVCIPLFSSSLRPFSFCSITCAAPYQPLSFSAAGIGEGEGKPGGADGALFQGAAGSSRLRQHQERRHTRPDVRLIPDSPFMSLLCCCCLDMWTH